MAKRGEFDFNLIRAMEVFVAVAESRHVTKAAKLLGITQSAASQHLRALETSFGTRLVDRASRPIGLTRAGMALHRRAAHILSEIDDLKAKVRRLEDAPVPLLRIGLLPSLAWPLAPLVTALARERMRIPELVLRTSLANDHQDLLTNREVDLVVTSDALYDVDGLERHVLLREPFYLVLPKEVEAPNGLEALAARLPYIRFSTRSPLGRRIEQHLRRVRAELPRSLEVDRASAVMAMIAAGQGFSILPPSLILDGWAPAAPTRIEALPLTAFSRTITLVCRQGELGSTPAALAAEMRKALKQHLRRHLLRHLPKAGAEIHFED